MKTSEIIREIEKLPVDRRISIIEKLINALRKSETKATLAKAAKKLEIEYEENDELTAFTEIDFEDFYEAK